MTKDEYLAAARETRRLGGLAKYADHKEAYLKIADQWESFAKAADTKERLAKS